MLKQILRDINRRFPTVGLPRPTVMLHRRNLMPTIEAAMDGLGIREYSDVVYPVNGGCIRMTVRLPQNWRALENREVEFECLKHASETVRKGSRILDVGARFGAYTLLFSRLVGIDGAVVAFEPDPRAREVLMDNVRQNKLTNVRIDGRCVAGSSGRVVLRSDQWGNGKSSIIERPFKKAKYEISVPATTVDKFCWQNNLAPDGIKIDVEGAERLVLEGAMETMRACRPWILLEFHWGLLQPEEPDIIWRLLTDNARRVVILDGEEVPHPREVDTVKMPDYSFSHVFVQC